MQTKKPGLTISRRTGESVLIGEDILITVMRETPSRLVLRIDAPEDVPIWRTELLQKD